jgi:hypothetical protein
VQENILSQLNRTSSIPLFSGVTDLSPGVNSNRVAWFGTNNYPVGTGSSQKDLQLITSHGGYPFLTAPFDFNNYVNGVVGLPVYSENAQWNGTGPWVPGGGGLWDQYLQRGIIAMGYVQNHAYFRNAIQYYTTGGGPATYVYADMLSWPSIIEAMAQGRSFGEYGWINQQLSPNVMNLNFNAEDDNVMMGRFPIYVSADTQTVGLHVTVAKLPNFNQISVRMIEDGQVVGTINPVSSTINEEDNYLLNPGPGVHYFRYEVYSINNPILAFSNPIFFVRNPSLPSGAWIAETPGLAYGTANSSLSNIMENSTSVVFTVNGQPGLSIVTSLYSSIAPVDSNLCNASFQYDAQSKVLKVTTIIPSTGSQQVIISYSGKICRFNVSSSQTVVSGIIGKALMSTITVNSVNGFTDTVKLSQNAGNACSFSAEQILLAADNSATSVLTCTFGSVGNRTVTILAAANSVSVNSNVVFSIQDFALSASPNSFVSRPYTSMLSTITIQALNSYSNNTVLKYTVSPSNNSLSCSLSPNVVTSGHGSSQLWCSGPSGTYTVTVTGTVGSLTHSVSLTLSVASNSSNLPSAAILANWPFIVAGGVVTVFAGFAIALRSRRK